MDSERSTSRVAIISCPSYDKNAVHEAVGRGLALIGGPEEIVTRGEGILLKPNLLVGSAPENATTTHPEVFRAVARHLLAAGVALTYGDSPGFGRLADVVRRTGLDPIAKELGIPLADFATPEAVSFREGLLVKQFTIAKGVLAADGIVSLPKLKTHGLTRMTGAIKNQYGCIPGLLKAEFHARLPHAERFSEMLIDLNRLLRPRLYIMDGIIGMEGNGPRGGDPRQMGALLFSTDPIALDTVACRLMNLDPALVPTNIAGENMGLGTMTDIHLVGDPIEPMIANDYAANRASFMATTMQSPLGALARKFIVPRPVVMSEQCTKCGTCVRICPVDPKAISFSDGRKAPPVHDYEACIRCYCCQEMCPEGAIIIRTPFLGKLFRRA